MRLKYFLAIVVTLLIMGALFYKDRPENPMQTIAEDSEDATQVDQPDVTKKLDQVMEKQADDSKTLKDKASVVATSEQAVEIQKTFAEHVKKIGACLGVQSTLPVSDKIEPTFDNLSNNLRPMLGEVVVHMADWTQQDIKSSDGSLKRLRTEVEYQDTGNPIKRTQLYKINAQGMPELQNLNPELSNDPTDEYLNSLIGDGEVNLEEKGGRVYYQEGEELVLVERAGKLQSFSITKGEKTYSCTETDATTSNCQCL